MAGLIECVSWAEFKTLVAERIYQGLPAARHSYLFRGHGNTEYQLSPSFDRAFLEYEGADRDLLEERLLAHFKKECEADDTCRMLMGKDITTLALAQHYGLPTRLLDWTESPYVAAFFAFQGHFQDSIFGRPRGSNVGIWILDPKSYVWSPKRGVQLISPASWDNERLRKQAGWFTLSRTPFRNLTDYVAQFPDASDALTQVSIPSSEARLAIPDLDLMGINHAHLFSDLEGRARSAVTRTLMELSRRDYRSNRASDLTATNNEVDHNSSGAANQRYR